MSIHLPGTSATFGPPLCLDHACCACFACLSVLLVVQSTSAGTGRTRVRQASASRSSPRPRLAARLARPRLYSARGLSLIAARAVMGWGSGPRGPTRGPPRGPRPRDRSGYDAGRDDPRDRDRPPPPPRDRDCVAAARGAAHAQLLLPRVQAVRTSSNHAEELPGRCEGYICDRLFLHGQAGAARPCRISDCID